MSPSPEKIEFWFVGISPNGEMEWERGVGGAISSNPGNVCVTADRRTVFAEGRVRDYPGEIRLAIFDSTFSKYREHRLHPYIKTVELGPWVTGILPLADGGFLIAGASSPGGASDVWLCRTDAKEELVWNQTYKVPPFLLECGGIALTSDGGCLLTGTAKTRPPERWDAWLMKIASDGSREWLNLYGDSTHAESGNSVMVTADGNIVLVGFAQAQQGRQRGEAMGWMLKTDNSGTKQWEKLFPGTVIEVTNSESEAWATFNSVCESADGNYVAAGSDFQDFVLVKVSQNGELLWNRRYGTRLHDTCTIVRSTKDGGFVLCGLTDEEDDAFVVRTDSDGRGLWRYNFGGTGTEYCYDIFEMQDGRFVLAGIRTPYGRAIHAAGG